jgi:hypothetical protein
MDRNADELINKYIHSWSREESISNSEHLWVEQVASGQKDVERSKTEHTIPGLFQGFMIANSEIILHVVYYVYAVPPLPPYSQM